MDENDKDLHKNCNAYGWLSGSLTPFLFKTSCIDKRVNSYITRINSIPPGKIKILFFTSPNPKSYRVFNLFKSSNVEFL